MNKKRLLDICSNKPQCYCRILEQNERGITIIVDEGLSTPQNHLEESCAQDIIESYLDDIDIALETADVVISSFADSSLCYLGEDVLYQTILKCFAEHRPLVLSPDMIWLVINQALAKHIDEYSSRYRRNVVSHKGKLGLNVNSQTDLFDKKTDWNGILDSFYEQISANTLNDIVPAMVCNFSTTNNDERIASVITLMTGLKAYFNYRVHHKVCGIPQVTLYGNVKDWEEVADKARILKKFGLSKWHEWLEPILHEFVNSVGGSPNLKFWKSIVMTLPSDDFYSSTERRGCTPLEPNYLDGWFLALFLSLGKSKFDFNMHHKNFAANSEMCRVGFVYNIYDFTGTKLYTYPMELWSGFVGVEEDKDTFALKPHIGWFVRKSHQDEDLLKSLKSDIDIRGSLHVDVGDVNPSVLERLGEVPRLTLIGFEKNPILPDWLDRIKFKELSFIGNFNDSDKEVILRKYPNAEFQDW